MPPLVHPNTDTREKSILHATMRPRRPPFLVLAVGLALLLLSCQTTVVVATAGASSATTNARIGRLRSPIRRKSLRGRSTQLMQHDNPTRVRLTLPTNGNIRLLREVDKEDPATKKKGPSKDYPPTANDTPLQSTKPNDVDSSDIDEVETNGENESFNEPHDILEEPTLPPSSTTAPAALTEAKADGTTHAAMNPQSTVPAAMSSAASSSSSSSSSSSFSPGKVIGIAVSGLALAALTFLCFLLKKRRNKTRPLTKHHDQAETSVGSSLEEGDRVVGEDDEYQDGSFTGVYRLREHTNLNAFLEVLGVSWPVRSAALRARPIHFLTHKGDTVTIKFKGVPKATYQLDGPAVVNVLGSSSYACTASYTEENDGFEVRKEALDGVVDLHLRWSLLDDNETVQMNLTAIFTEDEDKQPVQCTQIYERIGEF